MARTSPDEQETTNPIPAALREQLEQAQINTANPQVIKAIGIAVRALEEAPKPRRPKTARNASESTLDLNIPGLKLKLSGSIVHVLLSIGGLIGMIVTLADRFPALKVVLAQFFSRLFTASELLIPLAYAATGPIELNTAAMLRRVIWLGVYGILAIMFLWSVGIVMFSKRHEHIKFATDLLRTLSGFFIGSATTMLSD